MTVQYKLLKLLHKIYRKDKLTLQITKAIAMQIHNAEQNIQEIGKQQYLDSASWGLDIFEKESKMKRKDKLTEQRRAVIQAKWRGAGKLTLLLIQTTLQCYVSGAVFVTFQKYLYITMTSQVIESVNMIDIVHTIEEVKPAHIGWGLKYKLPEIQHHTLVGAMVQQSFFVDILPYVDNWESEIIVDVGNKMCVGAYIEIEEV